LDKYYNSLGVERLNLASGVSTFKTVSGFTVYAERVVIPRLAPGPIAVHEAAHVIASRRI